MATKLSIFNVKVLDSSNIDVTFSDKLAANLITSNVLITSDTNSAPDSKVGYFVSRLSYFRSYSLFAFSRGLPVTIFGKIRDENNEIKVTFYIPYRIVIVISLWFLAFILISIFTWTWLALAIGIFGVLFSILMILLIRPFYEGKMLVMTDEVLGILKIRK